ncbi:HNH endonuclease signature motif containing protein [Lactobacillus gasseri]
MPTRRRSSMPYSPKKPCRYPGCPRLTHNTYCDVHAKQVSSHYNCYQRPKRSRPRYHRGWPRIRQRYLLHHPFCEMCLSQGRYTKATEVHHVLPLEHGGNNDSKNLMALCKPCHSRITAQMDDRWHKTPHRYHY